MLGDVWAYAGIAQVSGSVASKAFRDIRPNMFGSIGDNMREKAFAQKTLATGAFHLFCPITVPSYIPRK
jgi:hypothetical protein